MASGFFEKRLSKTGLNFPNTCWLTAALRVGIGEELRQKFAPNKGQYLAMITLGHPAISPKMPPRREGRYTII